MTRPEAESYADLHNHLLPGVDDGAKDLAEAVRHLEGMAAAGVTRIAFSPHVNGWVFREEGGVARRLDELETTFRTVGEAIAGRDSVPRVVFGQEILVSEAGIVPQVFSDPRLRYAGTDYALVEFGFYISGDPLDILQAVQRHGRRPIIAHPERYNRDDTLVNIDEIRRWKEAGALLQVNAGSILGRHGDGITDHVWELLGDGLVDLVGTDNHGDARPDTPKMVADVLERHGAGAAARLLLAENPHRILDDRPTVAVPPCERREAA